MNKLENIVWNDKEQTYLFNGVAMTSGVAKKIYPEYKIQIETFTRMEYLKDVTRIDFEEKIDKNGKSIYYVNGIEVSINDSKNDKSTFMFYDTEEGEKKGHFYLGYESRSIINQSIAITCTDRNQNYNQMSNI